MPTALARPSRTTSAARDRAAGALGVAAATLAVGSAGLFASRYVSPRAVPVQPDTWAMVSAFTDLAAPGLLTATVAAWVAVGLRRRRAALVLAALCTATTVVPVLVLVPRWVPAPAGPTHRLVTVLALNARLGGADPVALAAVARTVDVVVLTEATAPLLRALTAVGLDDRLPYRSDGELPDAGARGTVVLSRFPITSTAPLTAGLAHQSRVCRIELPDADPALTVVAVHPARPWLGGTQWLPEQEALRDALPTSGPRLLAGDFNAVASHPTQRALVRDGWRSAVDEAGAGWVPTYPADGRVVPPLIDLDHVYVDGLRTVAARSVRVPGTDHLGLLVTVDVPPAR